MHKVLVGVIQPRARRQRKDRRVPVDLYSNEFHRPRSKESAHQRGLSRGLVTRSKYKNVPSSSVRKLAIDRIQHRAQQDTILQPDVHEHGWLRLVDTGIEHIRNANRRRRGRQSLQTDGIKRTFRVQRDDTNSLVFTTHSL
jgi:hypothetical protein